MQGHRTGYAGRTPWDPAQKGGTCRKGDLSAPKPRLWEENGMDTGRACYKTRNRSTRQTHKLRRSEDTMPPLSTDNTKCALYTQTSHNVTLKCSGELVKFTSLSEESSQQLDHGQGFERLMAALKPSGHRGLIRYSYMQTMVKGNSQQFQLLELQNTCQWTTQCWSLSKSLSVCSLGETWHIHKERGFIDWRRQC